MPLQVRLSSRFSIIAVLALLQINPLGMVVASGSESMGTLVVRVHGLESGDGNLRFALFDSEEDFPKSPVRAEIVEIEDREGTWTVEHLPYGTYAVLVHHDIDASGTMERHWYGKPKEPTGVSNNAPAMFGMPTFENAKFRLDASTLTLTVTLR